MLLISKSFTKMKWIYGVQPPAMYVPAASNCESERKNTVKNVLMSSICAVYTFMHAYEKKTLNELMIDSWKLNDPRPVYPMLIGAVRVQQTYTQKNKDLGCEMIFNADTDTHSLYNLIVLLSMLDWAALQTICHLST